MSLSLDGYQQLSSTSTTDALLTALEQFINSISASLNQWSADGATSSFPTKNRSRTREPRMTPEGSALLSAFENFIASTIHGRSTGKTRHDYRQETTPTKSASDNPESMQSADWDILSPVESVGMMMDIDSSVDSLKHPSHQGTVDHRHRSQLPSSLRKALRKHVHNSTPIRLLAFQPDGSGIELLERNTVLHRIYRAMEREIDTDIFEDKVDKKVLEISVKHHVTRDEAEQAVIATLVKDHTRYAILSHTWARNEIGELEYKDWNSAARDYSAYTKLKMFCEVAARQHGVIYGWMDSICINKESSSELDESIRSMYQWYRDSYICITILADTTSIADMRRDDWFRRGWTLQELLAPARIKFYAKDWTPLTRKDNDKQDSRIKAELEAATNITPYELKCFTLGYENLSDNSIPISRRMLWAANREVTRGEDTAYSLMGVFGVSISIAYGEGAERAFFRLVKKILNSFAEVWDVFNCAEPQSDLHIYHSRVIPSSPKHYLQRSTAFNDMDYGISNTPREPVTLTHLGLRFRSLFKTLPILLARIIYWTETPFTRLHGTGNAAEIALPLLGS
ncbi:hypothetical protein BDN70DRAFT_132862 [Pholiota conissans]|uniref:Heterokaryon incompatibility domain-containing protein n=1 Tax=Pholiota conissans TaxID=109636 RepID=A0A9P6CRH3_9AGAR|nr:hypothetical protein BDN70DRAFT_132862 [Pholiota conissans]